MVDHSTLSVTANRKGHDGIPEPDDLHMKDFPDLPIGVIVCRPIRSKTGSVQHLVITYCNPFAMTLFDHPPAGKKAISLTDIPLLSPLFKSACHVIETGIACTAESYEPKKGHWMESSIHRHADQCTIYLQNITPGKTYRTILQRRQELEAIIASIASRLSNLPSTEIDDYLIDSLAQIGQYTLADRAYIYAYSMDGLLNSCTHEWCAEGVAPQQALFQNQVNSQFPWWHQKMVHQEIISLASLDDLPASAVAEKESLKEQSIQSLLAVPLVFDSRLVGFVGFDMVQQPRDWYESDINLLKIYCNVVVSATSRLANAEQLKRINKRLEGLNRISNALLNSHLSEEPADLTALTYMYDMIPCEIGIVFRIDQTGQFAYADKRMRWGGRQISSDIRFSADYLRNRKLSQGKIVLINQLRADSNGIPDELHPYYWGHRSFLGVPLFAHQHYVGLLVLLDKSPNFFTEEHVLIAREVAGQLSILLLHEEANHQLTTQADKLNESNQLLQAVVDNIPVGLGLWQPTRQESRIVDFSCLLANAEYTTLTGLSEQEIGQHSLLTVSPQVRQNGLLDKLIAVAETGQPQHVQFQNNVPEGEVWSDVSIVRVGSMVLFTAKDISPLKYVEGQLRQTNADLEKRVAERAAQIQQLSAMQQAILTYAGLAITATDMQGVIKLVNPALEAISGYRSDELVDKVTPEFIGQPGIFRSQTDPQQIDAYVNKYGFIQQENTIITKAGKQIPVLSTTSGLYDEHNVLTGYVNFATDISYLKHIEKELIQANQRIQLATTAGKLGVWEWNLQTNELTLDKNFYSVFGLPEDTVMNHSTDLARIICADDFAYYNQHIRQIIQEHKPFDVQFKVIFPVDQSIHYMKADGIVLRDETRKNLRIVGIVRDRTAQKNANRALQESEKRYRSLVDHLNDVVFHIDIHGLWSYLNPSWQAVTGFSVAESLGKTSLDFVFPDDREHNRYLCDLLTSRQKLYCTHVVRYIHKEGGYRWISVFAQVSVDEASAITGITGTLTDITERKKAEEALLESEQRFRDIAENVDEIFWIRDLHSPQFVYMNSAYERFSGQNPQQLYKNPFLFLTFILEEDRQKVMDAFTYLPETSVRFRARHQNGSIHWLEIRGFVVRDDSEAIIRRIGMATDITSSIEKELILEESLKNERNLNYLKSQFISTASHEFRTPLATISMSVELLKHYVNTPSASSTALINQHIDKIYREVFSLNDLIANTLVISKIEEGKVSIGPEPIDLVALCETIVRVHFSDRADNRHTELIVVGNPVTLISDRKIVSHVIMNLLTNAFKFSAKNPVLSVCFKKSILTIQVSDKGIGIPAADLPNLFGKFFRARNVATVQGTGLGLAICQEYVTLLKGRIRATSREGVGTTVKVTLPLTI